MLVPMVKLDMAWFFFATIPVMIFDSQGKWWFWNTAFYHHGITSCEYKSTLGNVADKLI